MAASVCPAGGATEEKRATYHCNAAACHVKLAQFALGRDQCDKALALNGDYVKALMRRILCFEKLEEESAAEGGDSPLDGAFAGAGRGKGRPPGAAMAKEAGGEDASEGGASSAAADEGEAEEGEAEAPEAGVNGAPKDPQAANAKDFLQLALDDCGRWLELEPGCADAARKKSELEHKVKQKQERLQKEVMGKLKDLGNTILGKFGLSLDNFQTQKDPATGSYSINFKK